MTRLVALTGGSGFLGRHAVRAFADAGWRVRLLLRRHFEAPELADIPIEIVLGDLSETAALKRLAAGADAVVQCAGLVKAPSRAAFFTANAEGAARMAAATQAAAPNARFVLVSSMAARMPGVSHYAASKRAGEEAVAAAGLNCVVARPGAVYGPHDQETLKVLKLANLPVQIMLNDAAARVGMVHVRDAAGALVAMAEAEGLRGVFEITDGAPGGHDWRALASAAAGALGRKPRPFRIPAAVLRLAGRIGGAAAGLTGSAEMLTPGKVREILHEDWSEAPGAGLPADLWRPLIGLDDGLADMVAWARDARVL